MINSASPQQVLAFDFGTKQIGVAVGNTLSASATALKVIPADNGKPSWDHLDKLVQEWRPSALIIGLPLNMDGSESPMCGRARKFANRLSDRYTLEKHLVDERLSSREAREELFNDPSIKLKPDEIDSLAAAVILRSWLNKHQ